MPDLSQVISGIFGGGNKRLEDVSNDIVEFISGPPSAAKETSDKKKDPKKAEKRDPKKTAASTEPDPYANLAKSLVGQLQSEQAPIEAAISGALVGPSAESAEKIAEEATGISPSSATGQWMQQQVAKGAQETSPLMQALSAYGSAYGAGQVTVDQALMNMGQANDAAVNTAPEQTWLNAIASHVGTTGSGYYSVPENISKQLESQYPGVAQALQSAGFGGITTPKGGWGPGALPENTSVAAGLTGLGSSSPGTVPTYQNVTSSGNASQPS